MLGLLKVAAKFFSIHTLLLFKKESKITTDNVVQKRRDGHGWNDPPFIYHLPSHTTDYFALPLFLSFPEFTFIKLIRQLSYELVISDIKDYHQLQ